MSRHTLPAILLALVCLTLCALPSLARAADGERSILGGTMLAQLGFTEDDIWDATGKRLSPEERKRGDEIAKLPDPLEPWNRFWYEFNDILYFYAFKPVAENYAKAVPERPRTWIKNFFHNWLYPVRVVNCLLQAKFASAGAETSKFIGNTAFGLGGLSGFANELKPTFEYPTGEEDTGQTFGRWGVGNGMYLVWPFFGPSSARDTVGLVGDYFLTQVNYIEPWYASIAITVYDKINKLSFEIGEYETLKEGAIDPYVALRDAYLRMRAKKVRE